MLRLALDWDDEQIRMVAADVSGRQVRLRAAAVRPIGEAGLASTITDLIREYSLEKAECLVAIGRDRAELRQMDFPPVPTEELPDMVRFQAIRQFASAGESAAVDFITTHSDEQGIKAIVAATGPAHLEPIRKTIEAAGWTLHRVALRPIAAAALYRMKVQSERTSDVGDAESSATLALIDLVGDEAEIVLLRNGKLSFVRSVRLPASDSASDVTSIARTNSLAGEIRRSLIACGAPGSACNVVMWGTADRHGQTIKLLAERIGQQQDAECQTRLIDPLELVGADAELRAGTGPMVGRLAPLVGLLVADAGDPNQLIDFINPRQTIEPQADRRKIAAMIGIPTAVVLALVWMLWGNLSRLDKQIEAQSAANAELRAKTEVSDQMIQRTEQIDQFLDGDVDWLDELERLASSMPPADELILKDVAATSNSRDGGGRIVVAGLVTSPEVIDEFESAMRNQARQVTGDKVTQLATADAYRWQMIETIAIAPSVVRQQRYEQMQALPERTLAASPTDTSEDQSPAETSAAAETSSAEASAVAETNVAETNVVETNVVETSVVEASSSTEEPDVTDETATPAEESK